MIQAQHYFENNAIMSIKQCELVSQSGKLTWPGPAFKLRGPGPARPIQNLSRPGPCSSLVEIYRPLLRQVGAFLFASDTTNVRKQKGRGGYLRFCDVLFAGDLMQYVTRFQWESAKYPVKQSLRTISDIISKVSNQFLWII